TWLAALLVPVLLALATVGVLLLVDNIRLRVADDGLSVRGRRHRVALTWPEVASVGIARWNGHEWLAVWLAPGVAPPREKFMYPTWSPRVGAVLIGRLDIWGTTRSELRSVISAVAPDKWRDTPV